MGKVEEIGHTVGMLSYRNPARA